MANVSSVSSCLALPFLLISTDPAAFSSGKPPGLSCHTCSGCVLLLLFTILCQWPDTLLLRKVVSSVCICVQSTAISDWSGCFNFPSHCNCKHITLYKEPTHIASDWCQNPGLVDRPGCLHLSLVHPPVTANIQQRKEQNMLYKTGINTPKACSL